MIFESKYFILFFPKFGIRSEQPLEKHILLWNQSIKSLNKYQFIKLIPLGI